MDKALGVGLLALLGVGVVGGGLAYGLSTYDDADPPEGLEEPQDVPEQVIIPTDNVPTNDDADRLPRDSVAINDDAVGSEKTGGRDESHGSFADVVRKIRYTNPGDTDAIFEELEEFISNRLKGTEKSRMLNMLGAKQESTRYKSMIDVYERLANADKVKSVPMFGPTYPDWQKVDIIKGKLKGLNPKLDGQVFFDEAEQMIKGSGLGENNIHIFMQRLQRKRERMPPQAPPMDHP